MLKVSSVSVLMFLSSAGFSDTKPLKVSKFIIKPGVQALSLPKDASVVSAAVHDGQLSLWAAYTPGDQATRQTPVMVVPSDESFPAEANLRFVSTVVDGTQAWHVFADN